MVKCDLKSCLKKIERTVNFLNVEIRSNYYITIILAWEMNDLFCGGSNCKLVKMRFSQRTDLRFVISELSLVEIDTYVAKKAKNNKLRFWSRACRRAQ